MKTKVTKMPTSLRSELIRVERERGRIYCLIEISIFDDTVYCISINGEEFAAELVGDSALEAQRLFEMLSGEGVSPYQLFDIVRDRKREEIADKA